MEPTDATAPGSWRADPLVWVWLAATVAALIVAGGLAGVRAGAALPRQTELWPWALAGGWAGGGLGLLLGAWLVRDRGAENQSRRAFNRAGMALIAMSSWPSIIEVPARGVPLAVLGALATLVAGLAGLWIGGRLAAKRLATRRAS